MSTALATDTSAATRFCRDCAHHRTSRANAEWVTTHHCDRGASITDPVTGKVTPITWSCREERSTTVARTRHPHEVGQPSRDPCGPDGKHWTPRLSAPRYETEGGYLGALLWQAFKKIIQRQRELDGPPPQ